VSDRCAEVTGMTAIARLGGISLDATDPVELAAFYRDLL
jgi:hypothetical protein